MWSHRAALAIRRRQARRVTDTVAARPAASRRGRSAAACRLIIEVCGTDLRPSWQRDVLRRPGEVHLLPDDLIRAMLAGGFDAHGVGAGPHRLPGVVLAVPLQRVLAGLSGGAGHR